MSAVIIPARFASERLPGKPLKKIDGIPMIVRVAAECMKSKADRVIVVTDSKEILEVCERVEGLEVTMSSPDIKSGTDRVAKAAKYLNDEVIINVQGDEPFIPYELINTLIDDLQTNKNVLMNTACTKIDDLEADNPNVVKVVFDEEMNAIYFSRAKIPYNRDKKGCDYYKHIGIYGFKRGFLLKYVGMPQTKLENIEKLEQLRVLENGFKIKVLETTYNPISVDTEEDLGLAEDYIKNKINKFKVN